MIRCKPAVQNDCIIEIENYLIAFPDKFTLIIKKKTHASKLKTNKTNNKSKKNNKLSVLKQNF